MQIKPPRILQTKQTACSSGLVSIDFRVWIENDRYRRFSHPNELIDPFGRGMRTACQGQENFVQVNEPCDRIILAHYSTNLCMVRLSAWRCRFQFPLQLRHVSRSYRLCDISGCCKSKGI
jgi:hypothetical protein